MAAEEQLRQLQRLLRLSEPPADIAAGQALVRERAAEVADGLFAEAAAQDDVVDLDSARSYLELRLRHLEPLLDAESCEVIRARFEARLASW